MKRCSLLNFFAQTWGFPTSLIYAHLFSTVFPLILIAALAAIQGFLDCSVDWMSHPPCVAVRVQARYHSLHSKDRTWFFSTWFWNGNFLDFGTPTGPLPRFSEIRFFFYWCSWKVDIWNHIEFSLLAVALLLTSLTTALIANDLHFARSKSTASCLILICRMDKLWAWFLDKICSKKQPHLLVCFFSFGKCLSFWVFFWCEYVSPL